MSERLRLILDATEDNLILAIRAASALRRDGHKNCIYVYGENIGKSWTFYAKRNKASISVTEAKTP